MKKYSFIFILFSILFYAISLFYGVTYLGLFMRDFEKKYTSNTSSVSLEEEKGLSEEKYKTADSNIEGRDALMRTASRRILFNMFFSLFYYYLLKKNNGYRIKFVVFGIFSLFFVLYFTNIFYNSYYSGAGESITNIFDIDKMSY